MKLSSLIDAKWSSSAAERVSPFEQFYGEANVLIGGLHRNFYNASVYNKQN
jgi:hypothetical protein